MRIPTEGGAYSYDAETDTLTLIERTESPALDEIKAAEAATAEQANTDTDTDTPAQ